MKKIQTPWGYEGTIISTDLYSSRMIIVHEGERTPYIYHKKRDKTLFVLQGVVQLVLEGGNRLLQEGERYHIRPKIMHRIHALKGDATVIDTGTKFESTDIVIVSDDFSRVK